MTALRLLLTALRRMLVVVMLLITITAVVGGLNGWRVVPVLSGSMRNTLQPGSAVIMRTTPANALHKGQIIGYVSPLPGNPVVIHRIVDIDSVDGQTFVTTRGDANPANDPWTTNVASNAPLEGHIILPGVGWFLHWLELMGPIRIALVTIITAGMTGLLRTIWKPLGPNGVFTSNS
jgi:signal peptidase I